MSLTHSHFLMAYRKVVLGNHFFEEPKYYEVYSGRYWRTIQALCKLDLPDRPKVLEIGGGQIALLAKELLGAQSVVGDLSDQYADAVTRFGVEFRICDLLHKDLPFREHFDLVVLCEVLEHLPVPPHLVLTKMARWLKPGGRFLLTTPNLYRLRNVVRMACGGDLFSVFRYPEPGSGIGHLVEYSSEHVQWQIERAGLVCQSIRFEQLTYGAMGVRARIGRLVTAPLLLLPRWRDSIVAVAQKPDGMLRADLRCDLQTAASAARLGLDD